MRFAVENDCGSRHSHAKTERIVSDVFDDFTQTIVPIDSYGLEDILVKGLFHEFNTLAEYDDDIKNVLKDLLDWYEECIDWYEQRINGKYQILDEPRVTNSQSRASVVKISNGSSDEEDEESDDEDEDTCMDDDQTTDMMMVDASDHCSNRKPEAMSVDEPKADDGWTLVPCRKHKGKRN